MLRLPSAYGRGGLSLERLMSRLPISWSKGWALREAFLLTPAERAFARQLLTRRTQIWLFRCNQRAACGDFVAVDMSSAARPAYVIELKAEAPLKLGMRGVQLSRGLEAVAATGLEATPREGLTGSPEAVLAFLGAD
ncbi:hypothetical protein KJ940_05020 [Myxococcota bacterium]|nr:hypothetical protein [Myxococcota bacterium]